MGILVRVGAIIGVLGLALVYLLQISAGLVALAGVVIIGLVTGLAVAKWLARAWYGRQFAAGLRAGVIACGVSGAGALVFLLLQGPHSVGALAERSHLGPLTLAPRIQPFAALGWTGIDVLGTLLAVGVGIALSAVAAQVFALGKSRRAVQVIAQARLAAQTFNQSLGHADSWGPVPVGMGRSTSTLGGFPGQRSMPGGIGTAAPFSGTGAPVPGAGYPSGYGVPSAMTNPAGSPYIGTYSIPSSTPSSMPYAGSQAGPFSGPLAPPAQPQTPHAGTSAWPAESGPWAVINAADTPYAAYAHGQSNAPNAAQQLPASVEGDSSGVNHNASSSGKGRRRRMARQQPASSPTDDDLSQSVLPPRPPAGPHASKEALTDAMRDALAAWASSGDDEGDESAGTRDPKASAYLNSDPPKRTRKKQNTRDWLC